MTLAAIPSRSTALLSLAAFTALSLTARADVISTLGDHVLIAPPASTAGLTSDTQVFVWNERQNFPLPVNVQVDAISADDYEPASVSGTSFVIPAGTVVSSHFVHADAAGVSAILSGGTVFGAPVIGVIFEDAKLDASDPILGVPGTTYPTGTVLRGLEETVEQDSLTLDRRIVRDELRMTSVLDQVRILTAPSLAFSLDIGSDSEFSDPFASGNEVFDSGDLVRAGFGSGATVYWNDEFYVNNSFPDSPTPAPYGVACYAPTLASTMYAQNFDMDGFDEVGINLSQHQERPILEDELEDGERAGIFGVRRLLLSFDDDGAEGWGACTTAQRMPVESLSPLGNTYGQTAARDEVLSLRLDLAATTWPLPILSLGGVQHEFSLHFDMNSNPGPEQLDDDVDALDWIHRGRTSYFSVDQEGTGTSAGFNPLPGGIYRSIGSSAPVLEVSPTDLGLPQGTDVDAFEFAWIRLNPSNLNSPRALAVVFSVDQDDPQSIDVDESGQSLDPTLDARTLYYSFMNGSRQVLVEGLEDDVDALAGIPGDGGGGGELGTNYCTANPNSTGSPSIIRAFGSSSLSQQQLTLQANHAPPGQPALFYFGPDAIEVPFGDGFRCVGQPKRMEVVVESGGIYEYPVPFGLFGADFASMGTVHFQCWNRDPAAMMNAFNLSDALTIQFTP